MYVCTANESILGWTRDRDWMEWKVASMQQTVTDRNSNGVGNWARDRAYAWCAMANGDALIVRIDWDLKYTLRKMHTHIEKSRETERGENTHSRQPQLAIHLQSFQTFLKWFKLKFNLISILNSVFLLENSAVPWALQFYEKRKNYFCFSAAQRKVCCCVGVSIYVCVWVCVWESEKSVEELLKVASCVFFCL